MFGISLSEMLVIGLVTLVVVGPQKLPKMMRSIGEWTAKLRRITTEVRAQTGIDDILKAEGLHGGLSELRSIMRGDFGRTPYSPAAAAPAPSDPDRDVIDVDVTREYPPEGVDAYGALPDDLVADTRDASATPAAAAPPEKPETPA